MTFNEVEEQLGELIDLSGEPVIKLLNRYHITALKEENYTKQEVTTWLQKLLGAKNAIRIINDLYSYGDWNGN